MLVAHKSISTEQHLVVPSAGLSSSSNQNPKREKHCAPIKTRVWLDHTQRPWKGDWRQIIWNKHLLNLKAFLLVTSLYACSISGVQLTIIIKGQNRKETYLLFQSGVHLHFICLFIDQVIGGQYPKCEPVGFPSHKSTSRGEACAPTLIEAHDIRGFVRRGYLAVACVCRMPACCSIQSISSERRKWKGRKENTRTHRVECVSATLLNFKTTLFCVLNSLNKCTNIWWDVYTPPSPSCSLRSQLIPEHRRTKSTPARHASWIYEVGFHPCVRWIINLCTFEKLELIKQLGVTQCSDVFRHIWI